MAEIRRSLTKGGFEVEQAVIALKEKEGRYPCGYLQIGGTLYKVTTCLSRKDGVAGWVTIRKMPPRGPMARGYSGGFPGFKAF